MRKFLAWITVFCMVLSLCSCGVSGDDIGAQLQNAVSEEEFEIPEYEGLPVVEINNNKPEIDDEFIVEESFEEYGNLDELGRCTGAVASLSVETQPGGTEERGDISSVHPTGWMSGQGWERCHLIGWQLCAENANEKNLVTGTHYMNVSGMLPYENRTAWYIEETGNHVAYEVTPVYEGDNNICAGVQMQAQSVEDNGEGLSFNIFCFNVSPGNEIDYNSGEVTESDENGDNNNSFSRTYVLNINTGKFHYPSCSSVKDMSDNNRLKVAKTRDELIKQGYSPCGNCEP